MDKLFKDLPVNEHDARVQRLVARANTFMQSLPAPHYIPPGVDGLGKDPTALERRHAAANLLVQRIGQWLWRPDGPLAARDRERAMQLLDRGGGADEAVDDTDTALVDEFRDRIVVKELPFQRNDYRPIEWLNKKHFEGLLAQNRIDLALVVQIQRFALAHQE